MKHIVKNAISCLICSIWVLVASNSLADFVGRKGATLNDSGDTVYNSFSVSETTTFTLYAAADYSASIIIFDTYNLNSFVNGGSVSYYDGFSGNFGIKTITLGPGEYTIGARNRVNGQNTISYELEYAPVEVSNAEYVDTYFTNVDTVSSGGKLWHEFTIQAGYAYVVEGLNTGLDSYLIPASELSSFRNNQSFSYYPDYSADNDTNQPGLYVIRDLPPGTYYLAFNNSSSATRSLVYAMYRYSDSSANSGGSGGGGSGSNGSSDVGIIGSAAYSITGDTVQIEVDRVSNSGTGSSGTLEMSLWATSSSYAGGTISGYRLGEFYLGTLEAGFYFNPFTLDDQLDSPPDGSYYITLILTEQTGDQAYIVDYLTFPNVLTFGASSGSNSNTAVFDGSVLTIPEVVLPDNSAYTVELTYTVGSNPIALTLTGATPTSYTGVNAATFDGSNLSVPAALIGNDVLALEFVLDPYDPDLSFILTGIE